MKEILAKIFSTLIIILVTDIKDHLSYLDYQKIPILPVLIKTTIFLSVFYILFIGINNVYRSSTVLIYLLLSSTFFKWINFIINLQDNMHSSSIIKNIKDFLLHKRFYTWLVCLIISFLLATLLVYIIKKSTCIIAILMTFNIASYDFFSKFYSNNITGYLVFMVLLIIGIFLVLVFILKFITNIALCSIFTFCGSVWGSYIIDLSLHNGEMFRMYNLDSSNKAGFYLTFILFVAGLLSQSIVYMRHKKIK